MFGNLPTTGPLAPIVGLERRALEQRGVAPGQEQQGSAAAGTPISGDLARLIQLNRMIQQQGAMQQQANPAPTTVAQDLMQRAMQQRAPQMPPQMDPRAQGVANLPAGDIGTRYMAGGGIVAFAEGGLTDAEKAELAKLKLLQNAEVPSSPYGLGYDWAGIGNLEAAKQSIANRYKELLDKEQQAERQAAKEQQKSKINAVLGQYGIAAPTPPAAPSTAATPAAKTSPPPAPVAPEVQQAIAQRAAASGKGQGLRDLVSTLSAPKEELPSEFDLAVNKLRAEATKNPEWYAAERKRMEDAAGLTAIWKKQQDEQDRRMKELSPEAQRNAFLDNLSAAFASQIGQRGVSTSTRLAQMLGAYGTTKAQTAEQFKKSTADLNAAKLDLQEKQAMYRMTGTMADRKAAEQAQKAYTDALVAKESADTKAKQEALAEQRLSQQDKLKSRELDIQQNRFAQQAKHEAAMQDIAAGKDPQVKAVSLLNSYSQQLKDLTTLLRDPAVMADGVTKQRYMQEYADIVQRLAEVRNYVGGGIGLPKTPALPGANTTLSLAEYLKKKQ